FNSFSAPSLNDLCEEFFLVRNPALYNTLPKARKNTDPLPVLPPVRPRTPELAFRTNTCAVDTNTAKFLSEVNHRGCMSLNRDFERPRRDRSSTDVDLLDDVFCGDFGCRSFGEDPDVAPEDAERRESRSESFYQDLHSNNGSRVSVYEPLHSATKESPKTRFSTLERLKQQARQENDALSLQGQSGTPH
ncbi:hypothetical protein QZH41_014660, partial [Actinostola sp. cb2023]